MVVELWDELEKRGTFVTAWSLLEECERKRHLLKGMEEACQHAFFAHDSRALCPELTISAMLKQRGRAFVDFTGAYTKGKKDLDETTSYALPSEWWDQAAEDTPQTIMGGFEESTVTLLTLERGEFISESVHVHRSCPIVSLI
jgi:hypothetical protein